MRRIAFSFAILWATFVTTIVASQLLAIRADLDGLYYLFCQAGNATYAALDTEVRILHYVKPHFTDKPPVLGCPECYEYLKKHRDAAKAREKGVGDEVMNQL